MCGKYRRNGDCLEEPFDGVMLDPDGSDATDLRCFPEGSYVGGVACGSFEHSDSVYVFFFRYVTVSVDGREKSRGCLGRGPLWGGARKHDTAVDNIS